MPDEPDFGELSPEQEAARAAKFDPWLAAHDRKTAAHALEAFADSYFGPVKPGRNLYDAEMHMRERAAALRSDTEGKDQ